MVCNRSAGASSTWTCPTSIHIGWKVRKFSETFKSQMEKNKNVIHWPRSVRIGRNCALGRYSRPRAQFFPIRTSKSVNNTYVCSCGFSCIAVFFNISCFYFFISFRAHCNWPQLLRCPCQRSFCLFVCLFVFWGAKLIK